MWWCSELRRQLIRQQFRGSSPFCPKKFHCLTDEKHSPNIHGEKVSSRDSGERRKMSYGFHSHKRLSAIIKRLFYALTLTRETSKIKQLCPITKTCCSLNCILRCILRCSDVVRYYFAAAMTSCLRHLRTLHKPCA